MRFGLSALLRRLFVAGDTNKSAFLLNKMVKRSAQNVPVKERQTNQQGSASANSPNRSHSSDQSLPDPNLSTGGQGGAMEEAAGNDERRRVEYLEAPVKSETDKKEYRVIKLQNGLTALLISDLHSGPSAAQDEDKEEASSESMSDDDESDEDDYEDEDEEDDSLDDEEEDDEIDTDDIAPAKHIKREEKMAACAMCVGVGTFSDPPEIQGLAHFLEHMIFMGSQKYPKENDFDAFVSKYGGYSNAVTGFEQTTFHFCMQQKHFLSALDRFAHFFIKPLMRRDAITREREAVESEFQMALPADTNKKLQLQSSLACDGHPVKKFSWGNMTTLRDNVSEDKLYEELHKFRERHYSADRMKLAIQAKLPLDTLEDYVIKCFTDIPHNGLPPDNFAEFTGVKSFKTPAFHRMYRVKPVKDFCKLELTWVMPSMIEFYKTKPNEYLMSIIGNGGKGSLMSYLRKKLWCIDISCDSEDEFEDNFLYSMFCISLSLTDEGHEHLEEVLDAVFSYINLIKREGPQKRFFDELQQIEQTNFRFLEEDDAEDYVVDMSENMFFYPPKEYIIGNYLFSEYNVDLIQKCLDCLVPDDVNIIVYNKKYNEQQFDKFEPWFETKYADSEIPPEWIDRWRTIEPFTSFHLPLPNLFLVNDFSMIPLPENVPYYPEKIYSDTLSEIWYRPDPTFGLPDCYMSLYFISDVPYKSVKNSVLMDLYVMILSQLLSEDLYPAAAVGYNYQILPLNNGAVLRIDGYSEKLPLVLKMTATCMVDFSNLVTKDLFEVMKTHLAKQYYNTFVKPKNIATVARLTILMKVYRTDIEKHASVQDVTFDELLEFVKSYTSRLYIPCLVQGNITRDDVLEKVRQCIGIFQCESLRPNTKPVSKVMQLPLGARYSKLQNLNRTDVNSVVLNYYQVGMESDEARAMISLLLLMMEEPMFDQLRTKEQLGYDIHCEYKNTNGILGFCIRAFIQADKYTTEYVDERIEKFLKSFAGTLKKTTAEELDSFKETLKKRKLCADVHLKQEVDRNWNEIELDSYVFDRLEKEVLALENIKLDTLRKWYAAHTQNGSNFRKLSIHVVGNVSSGAAKSSEDVPMEPDGLVGATTENRKKIKYSLEYITVDQPSEEKQRNYVEDLDDFKKQLDIFPSKHDKL